MHRAPVILVVIPRSAISMLYRQLVPFLCMTSDGWLSGAMSPVAGPCECLRGCDIFWVQPERSGFGEA